MFEIVGNGGLNGTKQCGVRNNSIRNCYMEPRAMHVGFILLKFETIGDTAPIPCRLSILLPYFVSIKADYENRYK